MTDTTPSITTVPLPIEALAAIFAGGPANVSVERALSGLSATDATRVPEGLPHSVAQLLAHMHFWQSWVLRAARNENPAWPKHASEGWPEVTEPDYDALRTSFLEGLAEAQALARNADFASSLTRQGRPWAETLAGFATHTVYHVGQIVLTRRALGAWPPPEGGDTW